MASPVFPDPFQMWREALSKFENEANSFVTGSMKSQQMLQSLRQLSSVWLAMQQLFEKTVEDYLRHANLPSRKEVAEMAVSLRRIEDKLDRLLPGETSAVPAPRPVRTRRPPGAVSPSEPVAAAKETHRGTRTDKG